MSSKGKSKKRRRGGTASLKEEDSCGSLLFSPSFLMSQGAHPDQQVSTSTSTASTTASTTLSPPESSEQAIHLDSSTLSTSPDIPSAPLSYVVLPDSCSLSSSSSSSPSALVSCSEGCSLYLSGACHITLLQGIVHVNGHKLAIGASTQVLCPSWTPAHHVSVTPDPAALSRGPSAGVESKKKRAKGREESLQWIELFARKHKHVNRHLAGLTAVQSSTEGHLFGPLSSSAGCLLLVEAMDIDNCGEWMLRAEDFSKYKMSYNPNPLSGDLVLQRARRLHLSSVLLGDAAAITECCLEPTLLPLDWQDAVDKVCRDIKTCPRVLMCGAKGVGKSTCLRYTINRLLSRGKCVALLDCDLGQSECTVSGLASLHVLSGPLLSPSHLRLRTPELSFFLGDTTVKTDPSLFEAALCQLHERYLELRDQYAATGDVSSLSAGEARRSGTKSDASSGSGSSSSGSTGVGFSALDDAPFSKFSLPLVVNTDGWIKSLGLEVLTAIVSTTQPSHVLHLCTDKNKDLPALHQLRPPAPGAGGDVKIFPLKPVKNTASRIAAVDLRTLRLVAHFLRDSEYLRALPFPAPSLSASSGLLGIRNGAVVDPHGLLARALRESREQRLAFSAARLRLLGPSLAPRLVLGAMSLSLVGLMSGGREGGTATIRIPGYVLDQLRVCRPEVEAEAECFELDCLGGAELSPCRGVGIVSDVDLLGRCLHVIAPTALPEGGCGLLRGRMQVPAALLYCTSDLVCTPYMSSESSGEGSGKASGARPNLKRRGHQQ